MTGGEGRQVTGIGEDKVRVKGKGGGNGYWELALLFGPFMANHIKIRPQVCLAENKYLNKKIFWGINYPVADLKKFLNSQK